MAYATLLSLTQSVEQILHSDDQSLVLHETERQIIRSLHEKTSFLLSFLENDSLKYGHGESSLELRIRDAAYEAEAMIESGFPYNNRSETKIHCFWEILSVFLNVIPLFRHRESCLEFRHDDLKKIVEELDSIKEEVVKMKERSQIKDLPQAKSLPTASTESDSADHNGIVGLREEMMEIKDRLTGLPSRREIISIVGMPGIGKTTLTKTLYDDPTIVKHFDVRAWITVSHDYDLQRMLMGILDSIQKNNDKSYPEDLATHLHKTLRGRRYIIVMDDVWETNAWDQVKRFFPCDSNGSRVILTTRLQEVAIHVDCPDSIYYPSLLSIDDSWKLLYQKAFGTEHYPLEFEGVGMEIANNCRGLPLSLAVIGGILNKAARTVDYWRLVAQNVNSALNDTHDEVMNIISLSYKHLPHHLRGCFLYMGVFDEDLAISKSKLMRLWVAEGFIKPDPSKSLEQVAYEYLENLIDRNMIIVRERDYAGGIKKCSIHDLMRDLCMRMAKEEKFLKVVYSQLEIPPDYAYNFRHLYIHSNSHNCLAGIYGLPVNSLLCSPTESPNTNVSLPVLSCNRLRVLDTQTGGNSLHEDEVVDEIVDLLGLRYISLRFQYKLPSSISKLLNLQTLIFSSLEKVILPLEIWMMPRLRHIKATTCFLPYPIDAENGGNFVPMENLQTLEGVLNFKFTEDAIGMMPNLKKLKIRFDLDMETDLSPYCIGNLVLLHQLEALTVHLRGEFLTKYSLPENFCLPPKLKKLMLFGFILSPMHIAMIGSLQQLQDLKLRWISFDGSRWEPTEGEFLQLKSLYICETDLKYFIADETNFPMLQTLRLSYCTELIEIPSGIGYIQALRLIELSGPTNSFADSVELMRKEQQDLENNRLQIIYPPSSRSAYFAALTFFGMFSP